MHKLVPLCFVALAGGLGAGACSGSASASTIVVKANDSSCVPAKTELPAGKITLSAKNEGSDVTELYVLGDGDQVRGEVENVAPGTSRDLTVDLAAGEYTLQCKPGQKGDGIRTKVTVTGAGGSASKAADRTVEILASDYTFTGVDTVHAAKGETIALALKNQGTVEHEMEVFSPDGNAINEVGPTKPGAAGTVTITFDKGGTYVLKCGIEDHEQRGMVSSLIVP
jgi:uncharacterized cupredoxin-like copper-binding protein